MTVRTAYWPLGRHDVYIVTPGDRGIHRRARQAARCRRVIRAICAPRIAARYLAAGRRGCGWGPASRPSNLGVLPWQGVWSASGRANFPGLPEGEALFGAAPSAEADGSRCAGRLRRRGLTAQANVPRPAIQGSGPGSPYHLSHALSAGVAFQRRQRGGMARR